MACSHLERGDINILSQIDQATSFLIRHNQSAETDRYQFRFAVCSFEDLIVEGATLQLVGEVSAVRVESLDKEN